MPLSLNSSLEEIHGIGQFFIKKFNKVGVKTVSDLLFYFPFRYENFAKIKPIADLKLGETVTIQGIITDIKLTRTSRKKMNLIQASIQDQSGSIQAIWFNQKYLVKILKIGQKISLSGKIGLSSKNIFISNPIYEIIQTFHKIGQNNYTHTGRLVPIYPETQGLSSRWIRQIIWSLLVKFKDEIIEPLPEIVKKKHQLINIQSALQQIHFPDSANMAKKAKEYFTFQELFMIILSVLKEKKLLQQKKAPKIPINIQIIKNFVSSLPFQLTNAQKKSSWKILKDLEKTSPMNRLLQGDVGSGKTIVAVIPILNAIQEGYQTTLMAPTEILAKQHFNKISNLLENYNLAIALLTGKQDLITSKKLKGELIPISRRKIIERTEQGTIDLLIGTHALIQDNVKFNNLGLIIIDEQHRFGVKQRAKLGKTSIQNNDKQNKIPHFLSMTATPIPRTLALTVYGDLDLSLIDEMPKNRKKIITQMVEEKNRNLIYKFIKQEIKKNKQVFIVCPRINPSENNTTINSWDEVKAVTQEYKKLSEKIFPDVKIAIIHSKTKITEKNKIMQNFQANKIKILVCTSVIEVGIDIPNATIMIIEGAERFGLAQLYQIRGRIGRGQKQSYCFLFTTSQSSKANQRIDALIKAKNGFILAEKDLQIRGAGEFIGVKQSGIPDIAMQALKDIRIVEKVREQAEEILDLDPFLKKYPILKKQLMIFKDKVHFE